MTEEIKKSKKEEPDLYKRSIKGGIWVFSLKFFTQIMGFIKSIVVLNFLYNEKLELIIVANLLMALLTTFSESGFNAALVQKKEDIHNYLDTAWVISIIRGVLLFIIMLLAAPLMASIKTAPEDFDLAVSIIRVMSVCFLIQSFQNIGIVYFQKELQFHKTFGLTMAGTLTDIILTIGFVLMFKSVWGYVAAQLITASVNLTLSYLLCSYRPKFHFIPRYAGELWNFGKWILSGNCINYLLNEGDDWFVLAFLGHNALKMYRYAFRFSNIPTTHIALTISQVAFPAYSKIQHDIPRLKEAYLKVLQLTTFIAIPIACFIVILGPDFVRLFLVEQSHGMIPAMQILGVYGMIRAIGATRGALYPALNKMHIIMRYSLMRLVLLAIIIYPMTSAFGILGTSLAILIVRLAIDPFVLMFACKLLHCSPFEILKRYIIPATGSFLSAGIVIALKHYCFKETTYISFVVLICLSMLLYLSITFLIDTICKRELRYLMIDIKNSKTSKLKTAVK